MPGFLNILERIKVRSIKFVIPSYYYRKARKIPWFERSANIRFRSNRCKVVQLQTLHLPNVFRWVKSIRVVDLVNPKISSDNSWFFPFFPSIKVSEHSKQFKDTDSLCPSNHLSWNLLSHYETTVCINSHWAKKYQRTLPVHVIKYVKVFKTINKIYYWKSTIKRMLKMFI